MPNLKDSNSAVSAFVQDRHRLGGSRAGLFLLGLTLFGFLLRLRWMNQPIKFDEAMTFLRYARVPLAKGLSDYSAPNNHLFHTLLVHLVTRWFGDSPAVIRIPAFVAGVVLVPATYWMTRCLYRSRQAALFAAGLVAFSSTLIDYSTNARGYMLVALCFVLQVVAASIAMRRRHAALAWTSLGVLAVVGLYTVPTMLYGTTGVFAWLAWSAATGRVRAERGRFIRAAILTAVGIGAVTTLLYVPVLRHDGIRALAANQFVAPSSAARVFRVVKDIAREWSRDIPYVLLPVLIAASAAAMLTRQQLSRRVPPLLVAMLLTTGALVLLQRTLGFARVWTFYLPLVFAVASAGMALAFERTKGLGATWLKVGVGLACVWVGVDAVRSQVPLLSRETGNFRDAAAVADWAAHHAGAGDVIVAKVPCDIPLEYYWFRDGIRVAWPRQMPPTRRLLIVTPRQENAATLLADIASDCGYGPPHPVAEFKGCTVYASDPSPLEARSRDVAASVVHPAENTHLLVLLRVRT